MKRESHFQHIQSTYDLLAPHMSERARRLWAASQAKALPYGGVSLISSATGLSRTTIHAGLIEIDEPIKDTRVRQAGGGRKKITEKQPAIIEQLESLIEPFSRGDPESPLRWTCKSTRNLTEELKLKGCSTSQRTVCTLLDKMEYSLQSNRKTKEGAKHPDRNAQFEYIYDKVKEFQKNGWPVISVDTKKKELLGDFKNAGKEFHPKGAPTLVNCHEFPRDSVGKAAPYGVYDLTKNNGWVSVGMSADTAQFAVASIEKWWSNMGKEVYDKAPAIMITADCGGSNGYRTRLWKHELQKLADKLGVSIHVCHFPPGTSKWNKIEHRLFSFITKNWRGRPLKDSATIVNLIAATTTKKGLVVKSEVDNAVYPKGIKVSKEEMDKIKLVENSFHGEWNYVIEFRL